MAKILTVFMILLFSSLVLAQTPGREGDIVAFCADTRAYCEQQVTQFAYDTDQQIDARFQEIVSVVNNELKIFKLSMAFEIILSIIIGATISDILRSRRNRKEMLILEKIAHSKGIEVPKPPKRKTFRGIAYFLMGVAFVLFAFVVAVQFLGVSLGAYFG